MWVSRVSSALTREGSAPVESNEGKREMGSLPAPGGVLLIACADKHRNDRTAPWGSDVSDPRWRSMEPRDVSTKPQA
jgi:hypothetical protein